MNINSIAKNLYTSYRNMTASQNGAAASPTVNQTATAKTDSLDISAAALAKMDNPDDNGTISATSGKDALPITRGKKAHSFIIHFRDSAMVSRAVTRGYITVNGVDIPLSDEVKKQLTEIDAQAHADREAAFFKRTIDHNLAVAEQQSEVWASAFKDLDEAIEIAAKLSAGRNVSDAEIKKLMEISPQLYAMAMAAKMMAESQERQTEQQDQPETKMTRPEPTTSNSAAAPQGVSESDTEWQSYETQMTVSMAGTPTVTDVAEVEVTVN